MRHHEHPADRPWPGYERLDGRRRAVIALFAVIIVVDLLAVGSTLAELELLDRLEAGELVSGAEADRNDVRQALFGLTQVALFLAGAVVFIRWLRAAYRNADHVAPGVRRYGHGWAIGAWFVPILSLWRPKQVVNDVWRAGGSRKLSAVLNIWWAAWLVNTALSQIVVWGGFGDATLAELRATDRLLMARDLVDAVVAALAVMVVVRATARLNAVAAIEPAEPPWDDAPTAVAGTPDPALLGR